MKTFIKAVSALLTATTFFALAGCFALLALAGCSADFGNNDLAERINNSVTMPEQYSITYEVESAAGMTHTIQKIKDSEGNIYFKSGDEELLFMKEGSNYILYEIDHHGRFTVRSDMAAYNQSYVDSVTMEFLAYAERSKQQFMPGIESTGEQEILGRTCTIYGVSLGSESTAITYSFFVDEETGICMGFDAAKQVAGYDLGADGEIFSCTEFMTEDVPSLNELMSA